MEILKKKYYISSLKRCW